MKEIQDSLDFPNAFYRVTVKGLCVRDGKALLVHDFTGRNDADPTPEWELPGGGLDFGENFVDALKREVKEEMGLEIKWIDERPKYIWVTKHTNKRGMEWYWVCTIILLFDVVDLDFSPTEECKEIRFFSKEDMLANLDTIALQVKPLVEKFNPSDF